MFFLQMSGFPGSGKSTLAKEISKKTGAIIVDSSKPLDNYFANVIEYVEKA